MNKSISVCMATYNGEMYIRQQLESILSQISENDEVIISDDGSKDSTIALIKSFNDSRIRLIKNRGDHGYTSNFENALKHCNNEVIFLSDQDDVWVNNKVITCLNYLNNYDFIVHDAIVVDQKLDILRNSFFKERKTYDSFLGNLFKFGYLGCCMAFHRKILIKALPFPFNHKLCTHDNWLFLIASRYYKVKIIPNLLIQYRRHNYNNSTGGIKDSIDLGFMIKYRLYLLWNILNR